MADAQKLIEDLRTINQQLIMELGAERFNHLQTQKTLTAVRTELEGFKQENKQLKEQQSTE